MLYSHMQIHIYIYTCIYIQNESQRHNDKEFFRKICTSHFIVRVRKGLLRVLLWEGVGDRTELQYFEPTSYGRQRCVFRSPELLNLRPRGPLCWLSLLNLITNWSGPQTLSGFPRGPSAGCGFPYHISSLLRPISNSLISCLDRVIY